MDFRISQVFFYFSDFFDFLIFLISGFLRLLEATLLQAADLQWGLMCLRIVFLVSVCQLVAESSNVQFRYGWFGFKQNQSFRRVDLSTLVDLTLPSPPL